jgi:WD40 repeat protein
MTASLFHWLGRSSTRRILIRLAIVFMPSCVVLAILSILGPLLPGDKEESAGALLGQHRYPVHCLAFAPDGKTLASGGGFPGKEGEVRLWDVLSGTVRAILPGHQKCVYAATFSPDGRTLATTGFDGVVKLWDVASARERASLALAAEYSGLPVAVSANGNLLALAGCRPGLVLPGCEAGEIMLWRRTADSKPALAEKMVPIALGSHSQGLTLCRVNVGPPSRTHPVERMEPSRPDEGVRLLTDRFWDVTIGQQRCTLREHEDFISGLAFSPDGRMLASASSDKTVRLWDVIRGQKRAIFQGHTAQVNGVAFSADGTRLASGSHDRTVRLWEADTGCELATLRGHEGAVTCVAFSPDGRCVASGSYDKSVRLWRLISDQ